MKKYLVSALLALLLVFVSAQAFAVNHTGSFRIEKYKRGTDKWVASLSREESLSELNARYYLSFCVCIRNYTGYSFYAEPTMQIQDSEGNLLETLSWDKQRVPPHEIFGFYIDEERMKPYYTEGTYHVVVTVNDGEYQWEGNFRFSDKPSESY